MIDESWIPRRTSGLYTRRSDEGTLIETYHDGYETNQVGTYIWAQCGAGLSVAEIVTRTAEKFEADSAQVHGSVVAFIEDLRVKGFLE